MAGAATAREHCFGGATSGSGCHTDAGGLCGRVRDTAADGISWLGDTNVYVLQPGLLIKISTPIFPRCLYKTKLHGVTFQCRCKDPDNALMGPLDREDAASMPQSVLPATIEGHKLYMSNSVAVGNGAAQPTVNNFHFYGNIYQAATGGSSDGPMIGPSSYVFSAMPLAITSLPRAMIDFTSSVTSSMPQTGLEPGRVVGEVNDEQGGSGSGPSKIRNYTRPMVEEDVDDGGITKNGLAEKFFRVDVNKAST